MPNNKYRCVNGHEFSGDDYTLKCPECKTRDIKIIEKKGPDWFSVILEFVKKHSYIIIPFIVLIVIISIIPGKDEESTSTYNVIPIAKISDGYIVVHIKEYDDKIGKSIVFNKKVYDDFRFKLNNTDVNWNHEDTIYICNQGKYELTWTHPSSYPYKYNDESGGGCSCSKKKSDSRHKGKKDWNFTGNINFNPMCNKGNTKPIDSLFDIGLLIVGNRHISLGNTTTLKASANVDSLYLEYEWYKGRCGQGPILSEKSGITVTPERNTTYSVKVTCLHKGVHVFDSASIRVYVENPKLPKPPSISHPDTIITAFATGGYFMLSYSGNQLDSVGYSIFVQTSYIDNNDDTSTMYHTCSNLYKFPNDNSDYVYLDKLIDKSPMIEYKFRFSLLYNDSLITTTDILGPYTIVCSANGPCQLIKR